VAKPCSAPNRPCAPTLCLTGISLRLTRPLLGLPIRVAGADLGLPGQGLDKVGGKAPLFTNLQIGLGAHTLFKPITECRVPPP